MTTDSVTPTSSNRSDNVDPVLAELWAIKMQINEEANFSLDTIAARAHTFTMEQAKARISSALNAAQPKSTAERTQNTPG